MRTVYKYDLKPGENVIELPISATALCVAVQEEQPRMWALVNTDEQKVKKTFLFVPTGGELPYFCHLSYVGTIQNFQGWMVWHLFEVKS